MPAGHRSMCRERKWVNLGSIREFEQSCKETDAICCLAETLKNKGVGADEISCLAVFGHTAEIFELTNVAREN